MMDGVEATRLTYAGATAVITLVGGTGGKANSGTAPALPWGTPVREHRLNPWLVGSLRERLDAVEDNCACLVVHAEGTFFSNGLDLAWIGQICPG